ncbi:MAG TPA: elongation factor P [Candidatus Saccharimonadia bacterium]|jgi:elongation factor P|nr:elongation factor P [Candidatus Saccharimonadia bacterium]
MANVLGHTDLKIGVMVELDGAPYRVTDYSHKAMGRGGAVVQVKLKNLLTGGVVEKSFRSADKITPAEVSRVNMQMLYREGDNLVFMNNETYDQETVSGDTLGDQAKYVAEGSEVQLQYFNGKVIGMDMPNAVFLEVTATEPGVRGDTATSALKPATLETGVELMVPLFINEGDKIKVNTLTGAYLERQK